MRFAFPLLVLLISCPVLAGRLAAPQVVGRDDHGTLYRFGEQRVLVVSGTPAERGRAHGRLLKEGIEANIRAFLHEWALGKRRLKREELEAIWERIAKHIPARYHQELAGLAEGSGVPLADLQLLHAIPTRFHCTGTAATPEVTRDGKVYHTRSLDYSLDIGDTVRPQENSLLLVSVPADGVAHAMVGWAGFIGCVTGMNLVGVSVGEMGSRSDDETYDGFPMIFLLREVLYRARNLEQAKAIWSDAPRTCGYNFIFCDTTAVTAVECNRTRIRFFGPGDEAENVPPHYAIPGVVRRCNHFVDPDLAATQRKVYDPRKSARGSWMGYELQGRILEKNRGRIDAKVMVEVLRSYPPVHPCLHQAVMCPNDRVIWVSQAKNPAKDPLPGAQNQTFYRYDLRALVEGKPKAAELLEPGERGEPGAERIESGRIDSERRIEGLFAHEPEPFVWRMEYLRNLGRVAIHHVSYPSPGPSEFPENSTVHGEYYRPAGKGPFPAAVVLHISDGRFYVARMISTTLAQRGIACLFLQLPYYGDRRPRNVRLDPETIGVEQVIGAVRQAVRDIRRGAALLRERPEVDPNRVGIIGTSLGSFAAQLAAGADGGFQRCVFVLGGGSILDTLYSGSRETRKVIGYLQQRGYTKEKVAKALAPIEPLSWTAGIDPKGVLMINCSEDEVVPPASTRSYWEALGRPEIRWYAGGHYAIKDDVFEILALVARHMLEAGPSPAVPSTPAR